MSVGHSPSLRPSFCKKSGWSLVVPGDSQLYHLRFYHSEGGAISHPHIAPAWLSSFSWIIAQPPADLLASSLTLAPLCQKSQRAIWYSNPSVAISLLRIKSKHLSLASKLLHNLVPLNPSSPVSPTYTLFSSKVHKFVSTLRNHALSYLHSCCLLPGAPPLPFLSLPIN